MPQVIRNGHDKIIRFDKPIQAGGCLVRTIRIHNHYIQKQKPKEE